VADKGPARQLGDWIAISGVQFASLGCNLATLVMLAHGLGAAKLGAWVALTALTSILAPIVGLGFGNILIRDAARAPAAFENLWGATLLAGVLSGAVLVVVVSIIAFAVIPNSIAWPLLVFVCASDLIFRRFAAIAAMACQARHAFGPLPPSTSFRPPSWFVRRSFGLGADGMTILPVGLRAIWDRRSLPQFWSRF
jgi:hypothetical protein